MALAAALQFLTRIPIRLRRAPDMQRAMAWFPVAGALIGAAVGGAAAGAWQVLPPAVAGAIGVIVGLLVTGAFHEDGLADVADAFGGGWTVERRLEILKDSRHGTYGVAAMCASIVLRIVALGSLPGPLAMFTAAVTAHAVARAAAVAAMRSGRAVIPAGLGADASHSASRLGIGLALVGAAAIATGAQVLRLHGAHGGMPAGTLVAAVLVPLGLAGLAAVLAVSLARAKIGGINGDVLGTVEQVAECAVLVAITSARLR
jgi:adenosylcobinamide-GDP ribazoletransferase